MDKLRRTLQATVISISGDNTIKVSVERKQAHPLYGKVVRSNKGYLVHANDSTLYEPGDIVIIGETRPISKNKSWEIIRKVTDSK